MSFTTLTSCRYSIKKTVSPWGTGRRYSSADGNYNFCISTRVRKVVVCSFKKKSKCFQWYSPLSKKGHGSNLKCIHSRGERLPGQKRLSYFFIVFLNSLLHVSWDKPGSSMAQSQGIRMVLLGLYLLCSMWTVRVKQLLLQALPMLPCFSRHYSNRQIPITALTQPCLSSQQSGDIISIASESEAGWLGSLDSYYCNDLGLQT